MVMSTVQVRRIVHRLLAHLLDPLVALLRPYKPLRRSQDMHLAGVALLRPALSRRKYPNRLVAFDLY